MPRTGFFDVYVPDRRDPLTVPNTLTPEEIRQTLIGSGHTSLEGATMTVEPGGQVYRFSRVQGGSKGR